MWDKYVQIGIAAEQTAMYSPLFQGRKRSKTINGKKKRKTPLIPPLR